MKLSANRFSTYKGFTMVYVDGADVTIEFTRYSYESQDALYDVDIVDGKKLYYTNCMRAHTPTKFHAAIEKHFSI